ncbi:MAG: hypothetical protein HYW49_09990, partial [Deltaproteobacteria bacterium]|nr:hypothetical protein [Deltaproteobacteria bacterium]
MLRLAGMLYILIFLPSCAGTSHQREQSPTPTYAEVMTFESFSSVPLGSRKADLVNKFGAFKTEINRPEFPDTSFWILRDPRTGFQKGALTFENRSETLTAKLWLISDEDPEKTIDVAKSRFKTARFSLIDLPSENPHLLYGTRLLADEKAGISMEVN